MPSASSAEPRRKSSARKKKKSGPGLVTWLPVLLGILVTPFAVRAASIVALEGPRGFTLLYPYVLLLREPSLGLSGGLANTLAQLMMYLQFPLYGLVMKFVLRSKGWVTALLTAGIVHLFGVVGVASLAWLHANP
ncbi:hypothetical protein [Paracidobacterium acidisoli]|uniref:Uncharacterized protein n=1 Tax=Paracidobacterium acidisoli TaxID=2303751 RepID=A0A372IUF5_9BACT|nr:hypothetical protein [Paracidobacterium acidisoli]MBT9330045.1 hypothetical protein [Paracidobacterium acidisoli]